MAWLILLVGSLSVVPNLKAFEQHAAQVQGLVSTGVAPVGGALVKLRCGENEWMTTTDLTGESRVHERQAADCQVATEVSGVAREVKKLTFGSEFSHAQSAPDRPTDAFVGRSPWSYRSLVAYAAGRHVFGIGISHSHGEHVPAYMSESIGTSRSLNLRGPSHPDVTGNRVWDAKLVVKRRLFEFGGGAFIHGVAEANLPLDNDRSPAIPASLQPLRSRAFRVGLVISY